MNYRTLTSIITFLLLVSLIGLFAWPSPAILMLVSALVPVLIGILAVGVLRASEKSAPPHHESHWYEDHH